MKTFYLQQDELDNYINESSNYQSRQNPPPPNGNGNGPCNNPGNSSENAKPCIGAPIDNGLLLGLIVGFILIIRKIRKP